MSVVLVLPVLLIILGFTTHSTDAASWCACRPDISDAVLQKAIDYACGNGADCAAINQGGACYQPNSVRAHCSYAVNSYYQKSLQKNPGGGTINCDFSGSAALTNSDPSPGGSCSFSSTGGGGGGVTVTPPSTTSPPGSTTPTGGSTTPTGGSTTPTGGSSTPGGSTMTPPGMGGGSGGFSPPGSFTPGMGGGFGTGLGPSGAGGMTDTSAAGTVLRNTNYVSFLLTIWFSALLFLW